ncbi:DUF5003 domain-containing protein [Prevotella copri]|uniref:DUF5003 domain-containing protein n=1 Tax=Segatella copri TaxID=165179 RepID=A0AAW5U988_9BACT|nr:DUF5003 domain-containing protein [Segatella copri]MCW4100559.1 DUF5003 domain-containing protein [Segatella copri]MCW4132544.1 DUF5003 domain-containing protein [Segatella copri]MCW4161086.1 DUF5003 domain-containing protein [Segatella copri]
MKTLISKYWLVLMALVSVTLFTACSSDDDDAVTPVFPQVQTISGEAGEVKEFTFEANESWSLSSDKIWCKLVGEKADAFVLNGTAGKQTIKVKITADDASDDMSVAQLFLNMGGQKVAIAEVTRSAAGYKLQVFDAAGNDITETGITVGYNVYTKFTVKSNYRFAVTNTPAWVDLEGGFLVGTPNEAVVGGVAFKENQGVSAKYAIAKDGNYTITFTSEDGKAAVTIPVIYNGMTTSTMDVTYPTSSQWAVWNVSLDGKVFTQNGSSLNGGDTNAFTFYNFVPFTLKTLGDAYQLVVFDKKEDGLREETSGAVKLQGEKGDVKLTIDALSSGSREFLVYALPQSVFESLENGLDGMLEEDFMTVKSDYDRYFLMDVVQKKENKGDSEVTAPIVTSMGMNVDCALTTNDDFKSYAEGFFSYTGKEVFESTVYGGYVAIYPQIDGWDPTAGATVVIYDGTGNPVDVKNYEVGQDEKGIYVGLNADKLAYPIFAGFNNMQGVCQRVVFINNMGFRSKRK